MPLVPRSAWNAPIWTLRVPYRRRAAVARSLRGAWNENLTALPFGEGQGA